jgi:hypothetical protein
VAKKSNRFNYPQPIKPGKAGKSTVDSLTESKVPLTHVYEPQAADLARRSQAVIRDIPEKSPRLQTTQITNQGVRGTGRMMK